MTLREMIASMPRLMGRAGALAWQADRGAATTVGAAEVAKGVCQAIGLMGVNALLGTVLAAGELTGRLREALPLVGLLGGMAALGAVFTALSTMAGGPLRPKVERQVRQQYLERAYRVEMAAMEDESFHRLLDSAQYGATAAGRMTGHCVSLLASLLSLLAAAGVLVTLHPALLPMLAMVVIPRALTTLTVARHRYRSYHRWNQHTRASNVLATLLTDTSAAPEIRVHGIGPYLLRHFCSMATVQEREQARLARMAARSGLTSAVCTGVAMATTYGMLLALVWTGRMELAAACTAFLALRTSTGQLGAVVNQVNLLHEEALYVGDLDRLLTESADRCIPLGGKPVPEQVKDVRLENVTFCYPGAHGDPALQDVTLTLPAQGGVIALVGENGSGKTTLAKLLAGLYLPDSGTISWDGVDTADLDRAELFSRFAIVQQDHYRWPMTARVNATISDTSKDVTKDRLLDAAVHAGIDALVHSLPQGWNTLLSRRFQGGHQMSGGQWQKFGIARAHYRKAPILIVDEPTAALDAKAEQRVFDQILSLADDGQTVVLITHRMASVSRASLVYVLDHGRLVESGSPDELLSISGGHYRIMYEIQAAQFQVVPASQPDATCPVPAGRER
ncbi:ABC transporter ATP-binding protein [Streptomyces celluloflavus]|uniref:ABC transporter ATP-binding protein n=1 Tax=Streptomyces celluloflavus TaxID=58344 RepID=UPI0036CD6B6A